MIWGPRDIKSTWGKSVVVGEGGRKEMQRQGEEVLISVRN